MERQRRAASDARRFVSLLSLIDMCYVCAVCVCVFSCRRGGMCSELRLHGGNDGNGSGWQDRRRRCVSAVAAVLLAACVPRRHRGYVHRFSNEQVAWQSKNQHTKKKTKWERNRLKIYIHSTGEWLFDSLGCQRKSPLLMYKNHYFSGWIAATIL